MTTLFDNDDKDHDASYGGNDDYDCSLQRIWESGNGTEKSTLQYFLKPNTTFMTVNKTSGTQGNDFTPGR